MNASCVSLLCPQQQWSLSAFVVSKITRTCDKGCTDTAALNVLLATASSTAIVTCTDAPTPAPDLTGKSALQCYQCSGTHDDAACKGAQTYIRSLKVGSISLDKAAACTQCYVSRLRPRQVTRVGV